MKPIGMSLDDMRRLLDAREALLLAEPT
ncbi:MAG: hypothetical protein JJE13_08010 [Thermoleophilia bacterium]|nr:hypothetical protein [Thermoleophilia bacterium]